MLRWLREVGVCVCVCVCVCVLCRLLIGMDDIIKRVFHYFH